MKEAINRGWKFSAHKMHFGYHKLRVLGIIMTPHGRRPDPDKVDTLLSLRVPRQDSELKSFLGLALWFTEHIPGLAWNTEHMRQMLTQGEKTLKWSEKALQEFKYIKDMMRSPCILSVMNFNAVCILYTDACDEGGGCMIVQLQEDEAETVVAFGSTSFTKAQKCYHITRKEALAFIWALGHFHLYLSAKPFLWRTDHRALKFIFDTSKTGIPALQRYKLIADSYQFTTEWIPSTKMIADTMSRLCLVPAERGSTMINWEMISANISFLIPYNDP